MAMKRFEFREINEPPMVPKIYDTEKQEYTNLFECVDWLNELNEKNEHYKSIFFELVETALTDKNCRELYCEGILNIFDKANSLNQARNMIKEFLE